MQVPKLHYQVSVASFLSAMVINFTSLLYEAGATKVRTPAGKLCTAMVGGVPTAPAAASLPAKPTAS